MEFAIFDCMPLDSRLRGNDEKYEGMEFNNLNCYSDIDAYFDHGVAFREYGIN